MFQIFVFFFLTLLDFFLDFELEPKSFYCVVPGSILATVNNLASVRLFMFSDILFLHVTVAVRRSPNHYATYIDVLP